MALDPRAFAQLQDIFKFPRTKHLETSRLQIGDTGHDQLPYLELLGRNIVIEEKLDGANAGVSFSAGGDLQLQSRGHYLIGGSRERQFAMFKQWAATHEGWLLEHLEDRYVMYGEVMSKVHSCFYDNLPHVFLEFDVYDKARQAFLSTSARRALLRDGPVVSVPVLHEGLAPQSLGNALGFVSHSIAKTTRWRDNFKVSVDREGHDYIRALGRLDGSDLMEGLYLKIEDGDFVLDRAKWVRNDFVQTITAAGQHHLRQPYIPNGLAVGVNLYTPQPLVTWETLQDQARADSWT